MLRHHCSTLDQEGTGTNAYNGGKQEALGGRVWSGGGPGGKEGGIWVGLVIDGRGNSACVCMLPRSAKCQYFPPLGLLFRTASLSFHSLNDILLHKDIGFWLSFTPSGHGKKGSKSVFYPTQNQLFLPSFFPPQEFFL